MSEGIAAWVRVGRHSDFGHVPPTNLRVEKYVFSKSLGDLWAIIWHHRRCQRRGLKIEKSFLFLEKIKLVSEAPESYMKSFGPRIKSIALLSCQFKLFLLYMFCQNSDFLIQAWVTYRINRIIIL